MDVDVREADKWGEGVGQTWVVLGRSMMYKCGVATS